MIINDYFPYVKPRPDQLEVAIDINSAMDNDYHYIILDAGTGFGKSAVARTVMEYNNVEFEEQSFLLTATKQLQTQYYNDCMNNPNGVDYQVGLGRNNFNCKNEKSFQGSLLGVTCDEGYCKVKSVLDEPCTYGITNNDPDTHGGCYYWENKSKCIHSDVACLNYNVMMADNLYVNHYPDREIMVLDEAHNIEQKIMNEISIILSQYALNKDIGYTFTNSQYKILDIDYWINELENILDNYHYEFETAKAQSKSTMEHVEKLKKKINSYTYRLEKIKSNPDNWAVCPDYFNHKISFKPVFIKEYTNDLLFQSGNYKIFMSGSIIDYKQFCKDLNISLDDVYYRKAKSCFDTKHRNPIFYRFAGNLGFKTKKADLPKTIPKLTGIFNKHKEDKGLIHCNSVEFKNYIMDSFQLTPHSERLITYDSSIREGEGSKLEVLRKFKESDKPLILVSYSMQEGINLPYDNCRFQIFFKAPFLPVNDNQIKSRMKLDPNWYTIKALQKFTQMWGRGMRAEDDYAQNYIIDKGFYRIIKNKQLPNEVKEALT